MNGGGEIVRAGFERKYLVPESAAAALLSAVGALLPPDPYGGRYAVASLYLDTPDLASYRREIQGKWRLRRYGETYALMMVDIDHFKTINDSYGHAAGDAALVALAALLREAARDLDHIARLGGEEFCLLLPHTDLDGALRLGARVRDVVRQAPWPHIGERLTVSVGVAVALLPAESGADALARADKALYRAKAGGRDCVVLAEPSAAASPPAPSTLRPT